MARGTKQKLKLLYLLRIMMEQTDETHGLTIDEALSELGRFGVTAQRKSIYRDFEALTEYGFKIKKLRKVHAVSYYLTSRKFDTHEVQFLVEAIRGCRFLSDENAHRLIEKFEGEIGAFAMDLLDRQVKVVNRVKEGGETVLETLGRVHAAIESDRKVLFKYYAWSPDGKLTARYDGKTVTVSPWTVLLSNENYYLLAFSEEDAVLKTYRIDKMEVVDTAPGPRIGAEAYAQIDPEEYLNRAVNMFHGVEETVTLVCDNEISNVVFDLWPEAKQKTRRVDEDHFRVKFNIYVSNQFFAQLCGLGGHVRIKSPNDIRKQYIAFLKENIYNQRIRRKNLVEKEGTGEIIED